MPQALELLRAHWRPVLAAALVVGAFVFGRSCAPIRTRERVEWKERAVEKRVEAAAVTATRSASSELRVTRRATSTSIRKPTGEVVTTRTVDTQLGSAAREAEVRTEVRYVDRVEYRDREVLKEKRMGSPRNWMASALVGTQVSLKPLGLGPLAYGARIERRVLGPFFLGVWGVSNGTGGVSLTVEW